MSLTRSYSRRRPGWYLALGVLTVSTWLTPVGGANADVTTLEYKVKAGYLINFAKFVEWPSAAFDHPSTPIVVGLLGSAQFGQLLQEMLEGRTVNGRAFSLRQLGAGDDVGGCHILFVGAAETRSASVLAQAVNGRPVLTVGESARFCESGGMLNFTIVGGQVKLESNPGAATAAGLKISSKLLAASKPLKTTLDR